MSLRLYNGLDAVTQAPEAGRVVAIGVFDGVHRGHQSIIQQAVQEAGLRGMTSAVVTFHPHPDAVLRPGSAPRVLTPPHRKAELLAGLGIDEMIVVRFDRDFSALSPAAFCRLVLSHRLGARWVLVGENFRFGHRGVGTASDLAEYGKTHGFDVRPVGLVHLDGRTVSSTRIREDLRRGRVHEAARLLGRPHRIEGRVVRGEGRGRNLEAPTANIAVSRETALPRVGTYVTRSVVDGVAVHPSVTSVGTNPTFHHDKKIRVETLLLDFGGDLYGAGVAVDFLERIRPQRAFANTEALAEQIKRDVAAAREYHARSGNAGGVLMAGPRQ